MRYSSDLPRFSNAVMLSDREIIQHVTISPFFCHGYADVVNNMAKIGQISLERRAKLMADAPKQRLSNGLTSFGYDLTLAPRFKVFTNVHCAVVDPLNFDIGSFVDIEGDSCIIPPNSFCLAESVETIEMPTDTMAVCVGKSSYARCGVFVGITPIEAGWRGTVTIEMSNTTPIPARVHANQGIAQLVFFRNEDGCALSYADKKGKYQDQSGITLARG